MAQRFLVGLVFIDVQAIMWWWGVYVQSDYINKAKTLSRHVLHETPPHAYPPLLI